MIRTFALAVTVIVVGLFNAAPADAVLVTFDDAERDEPYAVGETFTSEGVDFEVVPFVDWDGSTYSDDVQIGSIEIDFGGVPEPSEGAMAYTGYGDLAVDFAGSVGRLQSLSIPYYLGGGPVNLLVNGEQDDPAVYDSTFFDFHDTTVNGVDVSVTSEWGAGQINLTGPIDRVVIGGPEVLFDNLSGTLVPEPTSLALLAGGGLFALRRRRR